MARAAAVAKKVVRQRNSTTPRVPKRTAGQRIRDELAKDGDTITVQELIGHAAEFADLIERCDELIQGKRSAWMHVRNARDDVLEVRIGDVVRERRQLTTELRHLFAEIHKQRAAITLDPDDDDDVTSGL